MAKGGAELHLIMGPVTSRKSTQLVEIVEWHRYTPFKTVLFRPEIDTRDALTHSGTKIGALRGRTLLDILDHPDVIAADIICIDEGQFVPDLVAGVNAFLRGGKKVYVAALSGDFQRRPIGATHELVPLCDSLTMCKAKCACGADAPFSKRLDPKNTEVVAIGGTEMYRAMCRACYEK